MKIFILITKYAMLILTFVFLFVPVYTNYEQTVANAEVFVSNWPFYLLALITYSVFIVLKNNKE